MAYSQELWDEAKKKCRIGDEEIRMAKEMGLNPKSLIKNIPNKNEMWKAPVKDWIHDMYEKRERRKQKLRTGMSLPSNMVRRLPELWQEKARHGAKR